METETGTSESLVGTTLDGRYEITDIIGQGGMSTVYKARHLFLKRDVAIKLMQGHVANSEGHLRFQREAQAVASLSHENIINVSEFGLSAEGEPYMVMDYLAGYSLNDRLRETQRAEPELCLEIFKQVAAALQHAHDKGIVHRDLKPSNVMLVPSSGDPKSISIRVVDFGLARYLSGNNNDLMRLTAAGELVGSPYYMSPEQIRDLDLDGRSDIYSLGCMMFETLTGCRPFTDTNAITVLSMHLYEEPPPFSLVLRPNRVPVKVEAIVRRCLEKSRSKRFQTMAELSAELDGLTAWEDGPAESVPMRVSQDAPHTPYVVHMHDTCSGAILMPPPPAPQLPPQISQVTGAHDLNIQCTLRMEKPDSAKSPVKDWLRQLASPLLNLAAPSLNKITGLKKDKGLNARKQRIVGCRILIVVLGDNKQHIAEAETDAAKYNVYYKSVEVRKSMNAQELLVLLSTEKYDLVHLHGNYDGRAIFKDSTGFDLRLSDLKRACDYAQVKLLWLASANNLEWLRLNFSLENPTFGLIITESRGENYPKFLSSILSRLSRGEVLLNSWQQVVQSLMMQGDRVESNFFPGPAEITFLP